MSFNTLYIFELKDIRHVYGKKNGSLQDKNDLEIDMLRISRGTITGLAGPNGSGKSTLLKILAFAIRPTFGTVLFNGEPAHPFSKKVRFNITLLTQEPYLLKRSVYDNIIYGLKIRGMKRHDQNVDMDKKISDAMSHVGLDFDMFAHRRWNELSGGEAQRVAMAARLVLKPSVLLLDEPTASVDADSAIMIRRAAQKARDEWGTTIIVASHDQNWLNGVCDSHLHLLKGLIIPESEMKYSKE
ncbi:HTH-type transcriptional regulator (fragment) [Desulfamplus magnetovallimortis]|uniref:HTH-type transcriptional regulator n=1 Tax=Desulfamplus magnetovallimortis TaxID=1246637 RepID=A0A1W1HB07_9BACT